MDVNVSVLAVEGLAEEEGHLVHVAPEVVAVAATAHHQRSGTGLESAVDWGRVVVAVDIATKNVFIERVPNVLPVVGGLPAEFERHGDVGGLLSVYSGGNHLDTVVAHTHRQ